MKHRDYVADQEARDSDFRAARAALRPAHDFQRALIEARHAACLTQRQLAERLGTKQSVVARMESGLHPPRLDTLYALATALGVEFTVSPSAGLAVHVCGAAARQRRRAHAVSTPSVAAG